MDKSQEQSEPQKKCFCARCFLPIESEDKVDIEGQHFHKICSMCCICRTVPTSLKMFYGHVFCPECFKTHVLNRFRGDPPRMHSNSWWMQWAPGAKPQGQDSKENKENEKENEKREEMKTQNPTEEPTKKCICSRCLQAVDDNNKIDIGGQSFHPQCAKCYFCHTVPTNNVKIYYGQVFCEECFHRHVLNRTKDNPSEFFRNCFEQWQNNAQFAEHMRDFMAGSKDSSPFIFMMQGAQPPFCRCGTAPQQEWFQNNEPRKCELTYQNSSLQYWPYSCCSSSDFGQWQNVQYRINESGKCELVDKCPYHRDFNPDCSWCNATNIFTHEQWQDDHFHTNEESLCELLKGCPYHYDFSHPECPWCRASDFFRDGFQQWQNVICQTYIPNNCEFMNKCPYHPSFVPECPWCRAVDYRSCRSSQQKSEEYNSLYRNQNNFDGPCCHASEFFNYCSEQWRDNPQFSHLVKNFLAESKPSVPFIYVMPLRLQCGAKSATSATESIGEESLGTWDLSFENRTEVSDPPESCNESANQENYVVAAAEKIEKLTKYLHENSDCEKRAKKWKKCIECDKISMTSGFETSSLSRWINFQDPKINKTSDLVCPKCLWQCGPILVNSDYFQKECCGDNSF